jgi:renalase
MVIAIIGAGLSGLVAANRLAQAGHEVTVFEKSRGFGGRMATRYKSGDRSVKFDHGTSYLSASGAGFKSFLEQHASSGLLKKWTNKFMYEDTDTVTEVSATAGGDDLYIAMNGMNTLGKLLQRPVDVRTETRVGGVTYFGKNRGKKKAWMVNLDSQDVFEADAVVIAVPSTQAYGIIQTAADELSIREIIRSIDEVSYDPDLSFMFSFGKQEIPEWEALKMVDPVVSLIINESSKRNFGGDLNIVVHTTPEFAIKYQNENRDMALHEVLKVLTSELGAYAANPIWHDVHFWRYARARKSLNIPFFECSDPDQPLAIIGDYFNGTDAEAAYNSAIALADHWADKYKA